MLNVVARRKLLFDFSKENIYNTHINIQKKKVFTTTIL